MWAWRAPHFGDIADLVAEQIPRPAPQPGHILIRVAAFGVNFADSLAIRGRYQERQSPPFTPGAELAGTVVHADPSSGFACGDRVMAQAHGSAAEFALVPARRVRPAPPSLSLVQAAAVPVSFPTAHLALFSGASLPSDAAVLVLAASGGVGSAALQLGRRAGLRMIAAAGSEEKRRLAVSLGASMTIDYREKDWPARLTRDVGPLSLVIDPVGGQAGEEANTLLGWRGRHALVGFASGELPSIPPNKLLVRAATLHGIFWSEDRDHDLLDSVHLDLDAAFATGTCQPSIGAIRPFSDYPTALADLVNGRTSGKAIITVSGEE